MTREKSCFIKVISTLHKQALAQTPEALSTDLIAQSWLLNEKLKDVIRPHLRNSIELFLLTRRNKIKVSDLINHQQEANEFRMRQMKLDYVHTMDAVMGNGDPQLPADLNLIYLNGRYRPFKLCSSKSIRLNLHGRNAVIEPKLEIERSELSAYTKRLKQVKSTRLKNLALRLINGDIFTKEKLHKKGMIDDDTCEKCQNKETTKHLLHQCWYSGRIWTRLAMIYKSMDRRYRNYDHHTLEFALGTSSQLSKPRRILHLEIIRQLTQKDRPTALPSTIIRMAVQNLFICEKDISSKNYYAKLMNEMDKNSNR